MLTLSMKSCYILPESLYYFIYIYLIEEGHLLKLSYFIRLQWMSHIFKKAMGLDRVLHNIALIYHSNSLSCDILHTHTHTKNVAQTKFLRLI